jgi:hypothetical protein
MKKYWQIGRVAILLIALLLQTAAPLVASAQERMRRPPESTGTEASASYLPAGATSLPDGTLLICRMETRLDSKTARTGDRFKARVLVPINDARGRVLVPLNSWVEGHVESAQAAQRRRRSGIIEVGFDRLITPDGQRYPLLALLAPATAEDRKRFDEEGNIRATGGSTKRTVAFVGGGAGAGALVGALTTGALLGAGVGAGIGVVAVWLAKGKEAVVEPGTKIGVELTQPLALNPRPNYPDRIANNSPQLEPYRPNNPPETPVDNPSSNPNSSLATRPDYNYEAPRPREPQPSYEAPRTRPTPAPTPKPSQSRPAPRPNPVPVKPNDTRPDPRDLQMVNVSALLAERASDNTVRVSITGQTPTAGWRLAPEYTVEQGTLLIKLKGQPPQGMVAQVISYPTTLVSVPDPDRRIQRVTVRGQTSARTTTPIIRGRGNTNSATEEDEAVSPTGTRIADKLDALVEDYAKWMRAWRTADGTYSFESERDGGTPEAQLLYAFDRLAESARVFRGSLTPEVRRRAVRELSNGSTQVNRLLPFVKAPAAFTQRWQDLQREINQLSAASTGAAPAPARRPN